MHVYEVRPRKDKHSVDLFLQPQIDTDFWSLPAASGRVHIIDDVGQRCEAGEHKRPLPVDSR
jgi:hypothetical protein